jgi:hypothetical protein
MSELVSQVTAVDNTTSYIYLTRHRPPGYAAVIPVSLVYICTITDLGDWHPYRAAIINSCVIDDVDDDDVSRAGYS